MSKELARLDNFVGTSNYGFLQARDFFYSIEAALNDSCDRPDSFLRDRKVDRQKEEKGPVVLYSTGESGSGKTRFWLLIAELLGIEDVDAVLWADSINTGKRLGKIAPERPYGDLNEVEFNWASFIHSKALSTAIRANKVPNKPGVRRRLVAAEAIVYTGAFAAERLEANELVEPHDEFLSALEEEYRERYDLPQTPKWLLGKNRALTGVRQFVRRQGSFADLDFEGFVDGITARGELRERGIKNRKLIFDAQTEEELARVLKEQGYLSGESRVPLADRVRFGAPPHAMEMVAQDVNTVIEVLWRANKITSPWLEFELTRENLSAFPERRTQILHQVVIPFYMKDYIGIQPARAFSGLQVNYEERGHRVATPITRINENYIQRIFLAEDRTRAA